MRQPHLIFIRCFSLLVMVSGCGSRASLNTTGDTCPGKVISGTSGCVDVLVGQLNGVDILYYLKNGQKVYLSGLGDFIVDAQGNKTYLK
jgi:hypothetical protein